LALISSESGLGMLLGEVVDRAQASRVVVLLKGDDARDSSRWAEVITGVLRDRDATFAARSSAPARAGEAQDLGSRGCRTA